MTLRPRTALVLLLPLIGAGVVWFVRRQSDEQRIAKRLHSLAACVTKEPGEGNSVMLLKTQRLGTLLDGSCDLQLSTYGLGGTLSAEAIVSHAARARATCRRLHLGFHDVHVLVDGPDRALVTCTARLAADSQRGERGDQVAELQCRLRKRERDWVFTSFRDVQVLRR